jgi:CheY-specific phosphatase CheX
MTIAETVLSGIPPELIQVVKESACATLGSMTGGEITCLTGGDDETPCEGLLSIVSFVGDLDWSFMLGLPRQTALDLTLAFMGVELEFESADMPDAVGELANILAGDFVARLEEGGVKTTMSLPTVVQSQDMQWVLPRDAPTEVLPFTSPVGGFRITIARARPEGGVSMPGEERRDSGVEADLTQVECWACGK